MHLTTADLDEIRQAMSDYDCEHFGLRVVAAVGDFDADAEVPPSRVWIDGEPTNELLPGASAIRVREGRLDRAAALLEPYLRAYPRGARVMLIGGDLMLGGEDEHEVIIRDAYCYWHKVLA